MIGAAIVFGAVAVGLGCDIALQCRSVRYGSMADRAAFAAGLVLFLAAAALCVVAALDLGAR